MPDSKNSAANEMKEKILFLETRVKHLSNELNITKREYERTARNYFDIYSNMGQKVEEQAELLRTVLDNIPAYVYWKNIEHKYIGCNRMFANVVGLESPVAVEGKTDYDFYTSAEEATAVVDEDARLIETNEPEFHNIRKIESLNGRCVWTDCNKIPLHDSGSNVIGVLVVFEDITEKLKVEKEQKKIEDNMRQSQKIQSLGVLAGGIAHDFNNILTPIMGYAEMAREDIDEPEILEKYIDRILKGSRRARELVRQILTFSRRDQQKKVPLQMEFVVKEAVNFIRSTLPASIDIKLNTSSVPLTVMGDLTQMHQVIINLCTNASHAIKSLRGIIEITLDKIALDINSIQGETVEPGNYVYMKIRDNGEGIPPKIVPRVFEPFFTTKDVGKGTGMGLSVVHGIIKGLNGCITMQSELGIGTVFNIFIPEYTEKRETGQPPRKKTVKLGDGEKIMFVDDDEFVLETVAGILDSLNYRVFPSSDPLAALEVFKNASTDFDMLLTDLTMPGMDGITLAGEVLAVRSDIPVALLSGRGDMINMENTGGIREMITKPVSRETLAEVIYQLINKKGKGK